MAQGTSHKLSHFTELSQEFFNKWRFFYLLSATSGFLAIIPAIFDYESSYSDSRTSSECSIKESSVLARLACLVLSLIAMGLLIPYRLNYLKWLKNLPMTFKENPPTHKVSVLEVMEMQRKRRLSDHFFEGGTWATLIIYAVFPYPGDKTSFYVSQQVLYENHSTCYYLAEVCLALMVFRLAILSLSCFNYGKFQTETAQICAERYGVKVSPVFSIRCYLGAKPLQALVFFLLLPGILTFGYLLRMFDRQLKTFQDFDSFENACWNILITMTTVGYGDTFASSLLGRVVVVFSIFWGGIILSLTFVTVGSVLQLKQNEKKAYESIQVGRRAADAIKSASMVKHHDIHGKNAWKRTTCKLREFSRVKNAETCLENLATGAAKAIDSQVELIIQRADRIIEKLQKLYKLN